MQYKYAEIADTVYFWFAANETTGTAGDGATPLYDVRLAGAAAGAAPTTGGTPTLLSHADYSPGLFEIAIDTTGQAAGEYAVFCTLTISTVNPAGFCGSYKLRTANTPALKVDTVAISGDTAVADTLELFAEALEAGTGLIDSGTFTAGTLATAPANFEDLAITATTGGIALSATQAAYAPSKAGDKMDLIDAPNATGISAIVTAINSLATYGLTALNTLLVTTGIKAATIPAATLAANQDVRNVSGTLPNVTLAATQASYAPAKVADLGVVQSADNNTKLAAIQADYARRTGDYSTYAGGDTSGVTTLLTRLSAVRAGYLDLLNSYLDSATSAIKTVVDAIKVVTDKFRFTVTNQVDANALSGASGGGLDAAGVRTAVGLATANLDTQLAALPTDADVNAACDTAISDAGIPAAVWAVSVRTLSSFGTLVADIAAAVWGAAVRTLSAFGFSLGFATPTNVTDARDHIETAVPAAILVTPAQKIATDANGYAKANVKAVNDTDLTGNGSDLTPWGPS